VLRTPRRESKMPPLVETTIAWMRSPTATSMSPSAFFSSARSISASPLPPTFDEGHLGSDRDDGALDRLAPIEPAGFDGRFEHRGEIFFLLAHCILLLNWDVK
jgi:hypothetical protein